MAGEHLDLTSDLAASGALPAGSPTSERKFVGVRFACCDVYTRLYISGDGSGYQGHCPRCARRVRFAIGPGGSDARFFIVS
jgi:hypothetical protein